MTEALSLVAYEIKVESFHINLVELHILAILSSFKVFEENLKYLNLILSCSKESKNWVNKRKAAGLLIQC